MSGGGGVVEGIHSSLPPPSRFSEYILIMKTIFIMLSLLHMEQG
jgi:hypothetical protein